MTAKVLKSSLNGGASFVVLAALVAAPGIAQGSALPSHGHYVAGTGSINKASQSVTVKQSSTTGIIDWKSFSIGKGNGVTFDNGSGATLNRVTGGNLSTIAGSLHATGSLYLMNNSGVIVSGTGKVMTGGSFAASSGDIAGADDSRFKPEAARVVNKGTIVAGGGVTLNGGDVSDTGSIRAAQVSLKAADRLNIDGRITARNANGTGGTLIATGRHIVLGSDANLSASGTKGGTVLIGGDVHGGSIEADDFVKGSVRDAQTATIAKGAKISADASRGAGGDIVIWSDGHTSFAGKLSATGQSKGGFAEVSSHDLLGFTGRVDLTSVHGATGTLLLDPENVTIEDGTTAQGSISGGTFTPTGDNSILSVVDLEAALATASVKVTTGSTGAQSGDITVLAPIAWSSSHTLTLDAYHSIYIAADILITGAGGLSLVTDDGGTGGTYSLENGASVNYGPTNNGGKLSINGTSYKLLYTMAQVQDINASTADLDKNYALATSLNASATTSWTPIGTNASGTILNSPYGFHGIFEGLGNTISDLTVNGGENRYVGFFGFSSGTLRDIGLLGGSTTGGYSTGGLLGVNQGTVLNAFNTGTVKSIDSSNGDYYDFGGLVGINYGNITNSYATGSVSGNQFIGGLVGFNDGSISGSYASGAVTAVTDYAGGLVGQNNVSISNSYALGAVSATEYYAGGLVGLDAGGSIDESYAMGAASATEYAGGIAGETENAATIGATTEVYYNSVNAGAIGSGADHSSGTETYGGLTKAAMMTASNFSGWTFATTPGAAGWVIVDGDGSLNNAGSAAGGTTPMLLTEYSINITNAHQLQLMELGLSANYTLDENVSASATDDKNVWGMAGFIPIGGNNAGSDFSGTFDGGGFTISHLTIDSTSNGYVGLFGEADGTIENLKLTDAAISADNDAAIGILAGYDGGSISGVSSSGTVSLHYTAGNAGGLVGLQDEGQIENASSSAAVSNATTGGILGGLVGYNEYGVLDGTHASGKVSGSGAVYAGGLAGYNYYGTVSNSYASGKIAVTAGDGAAAGGLVGYDSGEIDNSYATGAVSAGSSYNGGLIGYAYFDNVANSYASGAVSGIDSEAGGLIGYDYYGNVADSHASGKVTVTYGSGTSNYAGGLVGYYEGDTYNSISNSYATGAVSADGENAAAGGLVGYDYKYSDIAGSHASGAVSVKSEGGEDSSAGGLIGEAYYLVNVDNSYATGKVTGDDLSYAGGLVGYSYEDNAFNDDYATGAVKGYTAGGLIGYSDYYNFIADSHATGAVTAVQDSGTAYVGGLIGYEDEDESIASSYATGNVNGGGGTGENVFAGGLIGYATDTYLPIVSSYATGAVSGAYDAGGLVGFSNVKILDSYATGSVTATSGGNAGGLVGINADEGSISRSYATGTVTGIVGANSYVGGFVGDNDGTIDHSFSTGRVVAGGTEVQAGGFAGYSDGALSYDYATGSVTGDNAGTASADYGSFVGETGGGSLNQVYAVGYVSGTAGAAGVGGLVGYNDGTVVTAGYWDTQTTGLATSAGGIGLTTAKLQAGLPGGFSSSEWKIVAGTSFPYLAWQFSSGTPEVVSGTISGETSDAGQTVHVRVNGETVAPAVSTTSGANGYYYELLAPGTISSSGSDVLAYLAVPTGRANRFEEGATGSLTGFNLVDNTLIVNASADSETSLLSAMEKALGSNTSYALYTSSGSFTGGIDLYLDLSASSFSLNKSIDVGTGELDIDAAGTITEGSSDTIEAETLTGNAVGAAAFTSATNDITDLGKFTSGSTFELTDDRDLTVDGTLDAGSHTVELTTTGSGHDLAIDAKIEGGTADLVSADTATEDSSGDVDATKLEGSAVGAVLTSSKNTITDLGAFTTSSGFALTDDHGLTVDGTVNAGAHSVDLTTTGSGHNLDIDSAITGGTLTFVTTGEAKEDSSGAITASLLNVTADTGIELTSTKNKIKKLGTDKTTSGPNKITL